MDDDITYPVDDEISGDELRSWACIDPSYWEMEAKALYNPAVTIVAVCPDGTEIVVRSGWTERGHLFLSRKPVSSEEEFEVLRRAGVSYRIRSRCRGSTETGTCPHRTGEEVVEVDHSATPNIDFFRSWGPHKGLKLRGKPRDLKDRKLSRVRCRRFGAMSIE